ncbi:MAG: hypothetical protein Q4F80_02300 [bacterium]|nr:hypothetical protein [bacterium]
MSNNSLPVCPLMSAGNDIPIICVQDKCAWYLQNLKKCSMYVIGHNAMLDVKNKIEKK